VPHVVGCTNRMTTSWWLCFLTYLIICQVKFTWIATEHQQLLLSDVEDLQKIWVVYKYNARHHGEFHIANIVLFVSLLAFSTWRTPSECMSHFSCLLDDKLDLRAALQMRSARSWPQCMIVSCMLADSELGTAFCAFKELAICCWLYVVNYSLVLMNLRFLNNLQTRERRFLYLPIG
jgi:hypothetical protein